MNEKYLKHLRYLLQHPDIFEADADKLKEIAGHIAKVSLNDTDDMKIQSLSYIQDLHLIADNLISIFHCCECFTVKDDRHGEG